MSLQSLLEEKTKDEAWSQLHCYSLDAGSISGDAIAGAWTTSRDELSGASFTFTTGTGTVQAGLQSVWSRWNPLNNLDLKARQLTFAAGLDITTADYIASGARVTILVTIPGGESFSYPAANAGKICGSMSCHGTSTASLPLVGAAALSRVSATQLGITMVFTPAAASVLNGGSVQISGTITYYVA